MVIWGYHICKGYWKIREKGVAKLIESNELLIERLRALKDKSGMTSKEIAEKSNVPESTVTRILSGKTENPTIITVMAMTKAMGGTSADIFDDDAQIIPSANVIVSDAEKRHSEVVDLYREIVETKNKWIKFLMIWNISITVFIILLLILDLMNGDVGFFRY